MTRSLSSGSTLQCPLLARSFASLISNLTDITACDKLAACGQEGQQAKTSTFKGYNQSHINSGSDSIDDTGFRELCLPNTCSKTTDEFITYDHYQQTLYVLWPRGDVDTGYGHIVVRAGKGPTARALDAHFRALTTQRADTDDFIRTAAGRSDHTGHLITHLEEEDHKSEEEEEAIEDRQEEQEDAQAGTDGRGEFQDHEI